MVPMQGTNRFYFLHLECNLNVYVYRLVSDLFSWLIHKANLKQVLSGRLRGI